MRWLCCSLAVNLDSLPRHPIPQVPRGIPEKFNTLLENLGDQRRLPSSAGRAAWRRYGGPAARLTRPARLRIAQFKTTPLRRHREPLPGDSLHRQRARNSPRLALQGHRSVHFRRVRRGL